MKNLIIFHMESLANSTYFGNLDCFQNIEKFRQKSTYYTNYFSTATSTIMVIADMLLGDIFAFEKSKNLALFEKDSNEESIYEILREKGYKVGAYIYPELEAQVDLDDFPIVFGKDVLQYQGKDYNNFLDCIKDTICGKEPFAIYVDDSILHVSYRKNNRACANSWHECMQKSMNAMDETFGTIYNMVNFAEKAKDTVIVLVGDHGENYWSNGLFDGYTHAIPPYPHLTSTPLIVYNSEDTPKNDSSLICTCDIKELCLALLKNQNYHCKNQFVLSRNLYANQVFASDFLGKGYGITNGIYYLVIENRGLSFFSLVGGINNSCNLLDFYKLREGKLIRTSYLKELKSDHAQYNLQMQLDEVEIVFPEMLKELEKRILEFNRYSDIGIPYEIWSKRINYDHSYYKYTRTHSRFYYWRKNVMQMIYENEFLRNIWRSIRKGQ